MRILAIETSCDETAAAVIENGRHIISNVVSSQIQLHKRYGGVVPEVASRAHCESIYPVALQAMENIGFDDIDAIAATNTPGLIGALLTGLSFAKGLAYSLGKPLIPVNHITGHIASLYLSADLKPPFLALVISGGHTSIVEVKDYTVFRIIGRTRDDAVGECFDKCARALGFPYPGGIYIDKAAAEFADTTKISLTKPKVDGAEYDFSFSGLKTSVLNLINNSKMQNNVINVNEIAFALQNTIAEILTQKMLKYAKMSGYDMIALAGGVSANTGIRKAFSKMCERENLKLYLPKPQFCGDNAAMIGAQAYYNFQAGITADLNLNAYASANF